MLTYDMSQRGERPLYEYLYQCIVRDILQGVIAPHEKLPSKRHLAKHLGVSSITVEGAYAQLVAEGFVRAVERKGYYANAVYPAATAPSSVNSSTAKQERGQREPQAFSVKKDARLVADLGGSPAPGLFPYNAWARHTRAVLASESERTLLNESGSQGSLRLRIALCGLLKSTRGMDVSPDQIVVGAGAQYLYGVVVQLLDRACSVAVEDPGYPRLTKIYRSQGVPVQHIPLDGEGVDCGALAASSANVVHIMPSHQFPTGLVTSAARRYQLLAWAAEDESRLILEDDYDCEFRFSGRPIPSLQSIDTRGQVVYVNTFTKSLGSGFRMGYLVLPPKLAEAYRSKLDFYSCTVSALDQLVLAHFIEQGDYERHVNRMRTVFRGIRDRLITALREQRIPGLELREYEAGLHFVLGVESGCSEQEISDALLEQGVRLLPLNLFCQGIYTLSRGENGQKRWFLVDYTGLDESAITVVAQALAAVLR